MGGISLGVLWFVIVAIFWTGFFVLEGFDFGVGMLHSFIGRNDLERRVLVNTIGPVWDGNEVWLIVAGAVIFAAFPGWYATWFSSLYLAVVILLAALMARGVSFEYQRKFDDPRWRTAWRWALTLGSAFIPFLLGVALGDLLHGLPVNSSHNFTGNFLESAHTVRLVDGADVPRALALHGLHLPDAQDDRRAPREGAEGVGRHRRRGHPGDVRLHDLDPRRPEHGFRPQAGRGPGLHRRDRRCVGRPGEGRGVGLHRSSHRHRRRGGGALQRALSPGPDLQYQQPVQPHHRQHGQSPLHTEGDDGGGGRVPPDRARLPGVGVPHLSQAPHGAARGRRRRHGGRPHHRRGRQRLPRPRRGTTSPKGAQVEARGALRTRGCLQPKPCLLRARDCSA